MVFYALYVGAELDGLTNLQPRGGCDDPNFPYYLKLRCENCGETTAKATYVTLSEAVEIPKGRGTANLVQKCKLCGRDGTITMIPGQGAPLTIDQSQKGEKACLMVFDCRGYEPVEFSFTDGWMAESILSRVGLQVVAPSTEDLSFNDWWIRAQDTVHESAKLGLNSLIILGAWSLWKHRNRYVFDGVAPNLAAAILLAEEVARLGFGWGSRTFPLDSPSGTPFDIDCSEGEFADYDEKGECPVGLGKLESTFKVVKKSERAGKARYV